MKTYSTAIAALLVCASLALSAPTVAGGQFGTVTASELAASETPFILVELIGSLNAKKLKPGDQIKAQVAQDVLSRGRIVIPAESKILGHVTEATGRGGDNDESRLGIVFDRVILKHHEEVILQGIVHALAPPALRRSRLDEPDPMLPAQPIAQPTPLLQIGIKTREAPGSAPRPPDAAATGAGSVTRDNRTPQTQAAQPSPANPAPTPLPVSDQPALPIAGQSLSVGVRAGVFGLKGLSLSTKAGGNTPGPVIVSKVTDVKLEYGTQVVVRVVDGSAPRP